MAVPDTSLLAVARDHWRSFIGMWLLPIALLVVLGWSGPELSEARNWLALALFFTASIVAAVPILRRELSLWQTFFWSSVVPVLIWAALIVGVFGLELLSGGAGGGSA